jgi:ATPase subunit of ABC transporter with duplicated ATPase domains
MIATTALAKEYGARTLFAGVSLQLNARSRYGLVGANGSGKSTFMRLLAGDEEPSEGTVALVKRARVGVLRQDRFLDDEAMILDLAMRGDTVVWNALTEQKRIAESRQQSNAADAADAAHAAHAADAGRMADLEDQIAAHDGYTLEGRSAEVLQGLGIPTAVHHAPLGTLSGGFKLRVLLAQVLVGGVDILLLDEPTNHLDILTIRWLEKFLADYAGCAVIISHDQRFLDNVTSHTLDVDYGTITLWNGGYSKAMVEKAAARARKEAAVARAEEEIARKRAFIERFGAKNTKATQAQSRLKQIERIEVEELAASSRRAPALRFVPERPSGREVLELAGVSKSYGDNHVLANVSLTVRRGERVGIIGPNGLGKSTLLKIAVERLAADAGRVRWGHETRSGYFPQDHREVLTDREATPLTILEEACPGESPTFVRGQLGRALFSGEETSKKVGLLSGGECARLIFALLSVAKPNVLVLDEPTNHLDLEAIHALVEALKEYSGTLIFVSHDRWFVSELATRIIELTPAGPNDFPGTYAEYLARCGDDHLDGDAVLLKAKRARAETASALDDSGRAASPVSSAVSWEEQKRRRNRLAQLPKLRDRVMAAIEVAEARKKAIHERYADPGFYAQTSHDDIDALGDELAALGPKLDALIAEWEGIEREIADAESKADSG